MLGLLRRLRNLGSPPSTPAKSRQALRFGILGAARIGPNALITPARSHPDVVVHAVASRDPAKAAAYAQMHRIPKVYSGGACYQGTLPKQQHTHKRTGFQRFTVAGLVTKVDLLDDCDIDVVYIALPNGLHFEWAMRALERGKHVLVEKPMADTAAEAQYLVDLAAKKGLVLLEAIHYFFHPAVQRVKEIIDSGELGKIKCVNADFHPAVQRVKEIIDSGELGKIKYVNAEFAVPNIPDGIIFLKDDVRYDYNLGGGAMMDMGVYTLSAIRYFTSSEPVKVTEAAATGYKLDPKRVDRAMHARYLLPQSIDAETFVDFSMPGWGPFQLLPQAFKLTVYFELEGGHLELYNFPIPHVYHSIKIKPRGRKVRVEKAYVFEDGRGEDWWTSYRYQLEAFVEKVRGRQPQWWPADDEAVRQLQWVENVYTAAEMPVRPTSRAFCPPPDDEV
ncbi:uncharacterized protein FIBRA_09020 [Fibroporia radiculosa]|uniref:D-xylose 1-dehydrogenase (NADP(+), D-xylono-1,5-lactone-forming) n=1 Tax=Fibroporia radiculosa TaxID=599839 RepID=J4ICN6_9APHY|nr:uncharacterized protein FIBRA_09020 [Fibroporia radiculosa]CCM06726.1 predicted protein [Fibroporia radiculosa]